MLFVLAGLTSCSALHSGGYPDQVDVQLGNSPRVYMDAELDGESDSYYHYILGHLAYKDDDYADALMHFEEAGTLKMPYSAGLHATLAELYLKDGKIDAALKECEKILAEQPDNSQYLFLYAGALETLDRDPEAEAAYRGSYLRHRWNLKPISCCPLYTCAGKNPRKPLRF